MKKLFYFLTIIVSISLISCSEEDPIQRENEFTIDGNTYALKSGDILSTLNLDPIYEYEIALYSSPLDESNDPTDSVYHVFAFGVQDHGSSSRLSGIIYKSLIFINAEPGVNENLEAYQVVDGQATIKKEGTEFTIQFEGVAQNTIDDNDTREIEFSGYYTGELQSMENIN